MADLLSTSVLTSIPTTHILLENGLAMLQTDTFAEFSRSNSRRSHPSFIEISTYRALLVYRCGRRSLASVSRLTCLHELVARTQKAVSIDVHPSMKIIPDLVLEVAIGVHAAISDPAASRPAGLPNFARYPHFRLNSLCFRYVHCPVFGGSLQRRSFERRRYSQVFPGAQSPDTRHQAHGLISSECSP
jgi:hypothetical protein